MPNPNEPNPNQPMRRPQWQRPETGQSAQAAQRRTRQPWGIAFVLFLAGFVVLVVVGKLNVSRLTADVLKGVGAGLCLAAFVIARRARRTGR
jgi:uncharacterized membrane protein YfcA